MKIIIGLLFLFYAGGVLAQAPTDFLLGEWQVEQSLVPKGAPPKMEKELNKLRESYQGASFEFWPEAKFVLKTKDEKSSIQDGYWVYEAITKSIKVCKWENRVKMKPLLLEFSARTQPDGSTYFWFNERPVALKVKKL